MIQNGLTKEVGYLDGRLLKCCLGKRPCISEHAEAMRKKFHARLWTLRHLQAAGLSQDDLLAIYKTFLRSLLDYTLVVYHLMLTGDQSEKIESLQKCAVKIMYGHDKSYREIMLSLEGKL